MKTVIRKVRRQDGSIELFRPHKNRNGCYVVAMRETPRRHEAVNEREVGTSEELIALLETGNYCVRMSNGTDPPSLIAPGSFEIVEG